MQPETEVKQTWLGIEKAVWVLCHERLRKGYKMAHPVGNGGYLLASTILEEGILRYLSCLLLVLLILGLLLREPVEEGVP